MRLNYDCLRDVLLSLERNLSFDQTEGGISFPDCYLRDLMKDPKIAEYSIEDVFYCVHNLSQAGYITASLDYHFGMIDYCCINDITYSGHMFLRSIADENTWSSIKKKFGPVIQASLPVIQTVASKYILYRLGLHD